MLVRYPCWRWLVAGALALLWCAASFGQPLDFSTAQLNHRAFRGSDGAPTLVRALAQTADGTLWVGAGSGLYRFDGIHFVRYPGPADDPLPAMDISALSPAVDGGLWIGFRFGGVCLLRQGQVVRRVAAAEGLPGGTVRAFAWDPEGVLWVASTSGVGRILAARAQPIASELLASRGSVVNDLLIDRSGNVWITTSDAVWVRRAGESGFQLAKAMGRGAGSGQNFNAQSRPRRTPWLGTPACRPRGVPAIFR